MRVRRPQISLFLLICGVTLLVAIFVGEKMGDRVLHQVTQTAVVPQQLPTPLLLPTAELSGPIRDWRKSQVITVATDPGFPDPRATRSPSPTPRPTRTPTPLPTLTPFVFPTTGPTELPNGPSPTPTPFTTPPGASN